MKQILIVLSLIFVTSCSSAPRPVANSSQTTNAANQSKEVRNVLAHTTENQTPRPLNSNGTGGKWTQSGDPIDTTTYDRKVASAEKTVKARPTDEAAKKALAEAFFERGFALTEAKQYASALGDYRRALKYDPGHEESIKWINQINEIYQMLKKEAPKEGEEPGPLPFKKAG